MGRIHFGQIGRLKPEKVMEYKELHTKVWPDVLKMIKECCLGNYSIFIKDNTVFAYFEYTGTDYAMDMKRMADDLVTQEWWKQTKPCFESFYEDMESIFYLA